MSDEHTDSTTLYFGLTEEIENFGMCENTNEIKFIFSNSEPKKIKGIKIIIIDDSEQENEEAYRKTRRILNYIGLELGRYIDHKRPEKSVKKGKKQRRQKKFTVGAILVKPFDLDLNGSKIKKLIDNDNPILNRQTSYLMNGIKAYDDKNFSDAIKNFWLAIENKKHSWKPDYRELRNGLSHSEINKKKTISCLKKNFGLRLKEKNNSTKDEKEEDADTKDEKGWYIDTDDPHNQNIIKEHAGILKKNFGLRLKEKNNSTKDKKGLYIDTNDPVNQNIIKEQAGILKSKATSIIYDKHSKLDTKHCN